jgi:hypothetical protein
MDRRLQGVRIILDVIKGTILYATVGNRTSVAEGNAITS